MDFMRLLKSFEELLYEVMVMLVFFPRTLYLTFRYPQRMMDYADTELGDVLSEQYDDTLSPPLFLVMCLGVSHGIGRMVRHDQTGSLPELLQDPENLLLANVFVFSLFPLLMSLRLIGRLGLPLNRVTLRPPFFSQCFVTAPVAMGVGLSLSLPELVPGRNDWSGLVLFVLVAGWYVRQQAHWFSSKLPVSAMHAWRLAISSTLLGAVVAVSTLLLILLALGGVPG
jgi:hypothetical protein